MTKTPTVTGSITDVPGIRVGHADDKRAATGCTVVMCPAEGAVAGVDVRGAAPGTRETDLLDPSNLIERVHAVMLTGGSVFGLDSACGAVRFLEERGIGFDTGVARVPIVPAAVIYDLAVGDSRIRPDAKMGYEACEKASSTDSSQGLVGAGCGATVGKMMGQSFASPGGLGMASGRVLDGVTVGVLVVINAFGDIVNPKSGEILAGARSPDGCGWLNVSDALRRRPAERGSPVENTTLAVVATDALMTKAQARRVAIAAHDGLARAIRPVHTMFDGDTVFVLSTGDKEANVTTLGSMAADLLAAAIVHVGLASTAKWPL